MWTCPKCGENLEDQFSNCWKCAGLKPEFLEPGSGAPPRQPDPSQTARPRTHVVYKIFRGTFCSFDDLFSQAADFATQIGPHHLISISHSEDKDDGVVTVWYWE